MLNVGIIGIGNTGNQIAGLAYQTLKIKAIAINSSEKDLETVSADIPKKVIGDGKRDTEGAGKNRSLAKEYLKSSIMDFLSSEEIVNLINELNVVFIVSSTGGGTGSGTAPLMASIISKTFVDVKTILVGVLPVNSEALSAHSNTLEYLDELYSNLQNQTYMLYDNDKVKGMKSYQMMEYVNMEVVRDIEVIKCAFNLTTRYDSIDDQDMMRLISFPGRIMISRLVDIKEKDCDNTTIEDMLIDKIKQNCHVESQRDKKVIASGIITNLSEILSSEFDNHIPKVREFIGEPIHDFNHIYINEDRKMSNNVFLILSGLTPVNDKIRKISDRVDEIDERRKEIEEENAINEVDVKGLTSKIKEEDTLNKPADVDVDLKSIFSEFNC